MVCLGGRVNSGIWWQGAGEEMVEDNVTQMEFTQVVKGLNICFYFFLKYLYLPCRKQVGINLCEAEVFKTKSYFV